MKIKEAAEKTGLTEKAIRLYEDKGLIAPPVTEINGRKFRDYDAVTLDELNTIAGLRRSFFSLEQIARMQENPEDIPEVFDEYLRELREQYVKLGNILDRAESLTPVQMSDAGTLSAAMTAPMMELPTEDEPEKKRRTVVELRFRIWDEDVTKDQRDAAYKRYLAYSARWERRYGWELAFGKIFGFIGRHKRWFVGALILLIGFVIVSNVCLLKDYNRTFTGYRIARNPDTGRYEKYPNNGEPVTLTLDGTLHRYLFRTDYYDGKIIVDGFEPVWRWDSLTPQYTDQFNFQYGITPQKNYRFSLIDSFRHFMVLEDEHGSQLEAVYAQLGVKDDFLCIFISNKEVREGYEDFNYVINEYFIFPAESPEKATELFEERVAAKWQKGEGS